MKDKLNIIWKFILAIIRYKYLVVVVGFVVWVLFFDTYNLIDRYRNLRKLNELKKESVFFQNEIRLYKTQYDELFSNKDDLEKFAREQYQMKEENEDLFIIISD